MSAAVRRFVSLAAIFVAMMAAVPPARAADGELFVAYRAHVAGLGWRAWVYDGATAGTTGQARPLEALDLAASDTIRVRAHVRNIGWQPWVTISVGTQGRIGTTGRALPMEALQISLTGTTLYRIECRAHVAGIGWQGWTRDGRTCGTTGQARALEAVQLRLVLAP